MSIFATLVGISIIMLTFQLAFLKILPPVKFYAFYGLSAWLIFFIGIGGNLYLKAQDDGYLISIAIFILIFILGSAVCLLTILSYLKMVNSRDEVQEMMKDLMSSRYGKKE